MLGEYLLYCLTYFKDNTEKPYYMGKQLSQVFSDMYLLQGDKDLLFPFPKSIRNAKKYISSIKEVKVFENVGHGIETLDAAIEYVAQTIHLRENAIQHND